MKHTKKHRTATRSESTSLKHTVRACIIGTVSSVCIALITIAISALLLLCFDYPHSYILPLGLFCLYFSAFVGGFICALTSRERALFCGCIAGVALFFILWTVFSLTDPLLGVASAGLISLLLKAAVIPVLIAGALFGARKPAPRKRRPKNF